MTKVRKTHSLTIEESLKESEVFYRHLAELTPEAIVIHTKGNIVYMNPTALKLVEAKTSEEILGKPIMQFIHPDSREMIQKRLQEMMATKRTLPSVEEKFISLSGNVVYAEVNSVPFLFRDKTAILSIIHDITKRKRAEEEVKHQQERVAIAQKAGKLGTFEWDLVTGFSEGTREFEALYGVQKGYQGGDLDRWTKFIHPEDRQKVKDATVHSIQEGTEFNVEFRVIWPDKSVHYLQTRAEIIRDETGKALRMYGATIDITERKRLEQQKDEFISIASHELKTPVTSIKGYAQILEQYYPQGGQATFYLKRMNDQISRLTELINDLLDVSRIQSGKLELRKEPIRLDQLLYEIIDDIQSSTKKHMIEFTNGTAITIPVDKYRLSQVIINLLTNAIKYSPVADKIVVDLYKEDKNVIISVTDFGIGIAKKDINKIFEPFYQVNSETRQSFGGLGLGLHISQEIIQRHGGSISVKSKQGKGSTFTVQLPIQQ